MIAATCVEDMRELARRRLPRMFFDYLEGGSWTQSTARANARALQSIRFRQRVGCDVSARDTSVSVLGTAARIPAVIAPTGLSGLLHPDGELAVACAAAAFGIPYCLSVASSHSLEAVRRASNGTLWMQLSLFRDRSFVQRLIERAKEQEVAALVLTMDFHVIGQRHADTRNGLRFPLRPSTRAMLDLLTKWRWCWSMRRRPPVFGNIIGHADGVSGMADLAAWHAEQFELALNWTLVEWIKTLWQGPLVVKGILDAEDARHALDAGADAIGVSNHGGRQLDGAPAAIEVLPFVVDAVGGRAPVFMDGGIRSGQDILKAMALGARAVLLGRAPLYGLGAMGAPGVRRVLEILQTDIDLTLAMCGSASARDFDRTHLWETQPTAYPAGMTQVAAT